MYDIVFFGRGGQGAVTAAQIIAEAAFLKGLYAQAFPKFGIERRGAPVNAFARISEEPIEYRGGMKAADYAIVTDMMSVSPHVLFQNTKKTGSVVLNSTLPADGFMPFKQRAHREDILVFAVDATGISTEVFGETAIPITSVAMIGAFAAASGLLDLGSIEKALTTFFDASLAQKNFVSASLAYERLKGVHA